jgi:hypothetical protein
MLRFIKKRERKTSGNLNQPAIIANMTDKLVRAQHKIADQLNEKAVAWQPAQVKLALVLFCLLSSIICLAIMTHAILASKPGNTIIVKQMPARWHIGHRENEITIPDHFISKQEYDRLEQFRAYMDSLDNSADGRQTKERLLNQRPKLLDSLAMVEQLYNKQK